MYPNITIHPPSHFTNQTMLKSLNNNTSSFSMENLLSKIPLRNKGKSPSPEMPEVHTNAGEGETNSNDEVRSHSEAERLSPSQHDARNDVFFGFSGCFKNRICSNCGQIDCNLLHCRMQSVNSEINSVKDNKPLLKFSVSAILGTENSRNNNQNGKILQGPLLT